MAAAAGKGTEKGCMEKRNKMEGIKKGRKAGRVMKEANYERL